MAQGSKHTLIALDYCVGGELYMLLRAKKKLSIGEASFYASSILVGLEELHSAGVEYLE